MHQNAQSFADAIHAEQSVEPKANNFETEMEQLFKLKNEGILTEGKYIKRKPKLMDCR